MPQKTFFGACVTVVNMVVGSGVLAIPHAFLSAGVVLAPLVLSLFAVTAFCSIVWLFECQLRAWALNEAYVQGKLSLKPAGQSTDTIAEDDSEDSDTPGADSPLAPSKPLNEECLLSPSKSTDRISVGDDLESALGETSVSHVTTPFMTRVKAVCLKGRFFRFTLEKRSAAASSDSPSIDASASNTVIQEGGTSHNTNNDATHDNGTNGVNAENGGAISTSAPLVNFDDFTTDDVLEMDDIATAFGGRLVAVAWNVSQVLLLLSAIWLYFVVLCETALQGIGLGPYAPRNHCNRSDKVVMATDACRTGVRIYCAIFWCLLGMLTMRNWKIMPYIQRGMTILVYVGLSTLTVTAFIGLFTKEYVSPTAHHGHALPRQQSAPYSQHVNDFDFSKFSELFGAAVFCLMCHPGTSVMNRGMPTKESVIKVYAASFGGIVGMYIVMATVVIFYLGADTSSIVTLNWSNYNEWGIPGWGGEVLGGFVMLFPVASISASLTLYTRSLAESIEAMIPVSILTTICSAFRVTYHAKIWQVQVVLRLMCISIPATLCMISSNFSTALAVSGFFCFFLLYFIPCLLQWESQRLLKKAGVHNPCDSWLGHPVVNVTIFVIALAACGYYIKASLIVAFQ